MKKIVCILLSAVLFALCSVSVFAATRKDVIDLAKASIPAKYETYHIWAENILGQYDLTSEQWDDVLLLVESVLPFFPEDQGQSLHLYTKQQRKLALDTLIAFCDITDSTYLMRDAANPKHSGDKEVLLYKADGTLVATIDGDLYPDTTGTSDGTVWLVLSATLLSLAGAAFFVLRRRASSVA